MSVNLQQAINAIKAGDKRTGRQLLTEVIRADPNNDTAWVWLAAVVSSPQAQQEYLERALTINPHNETARRGLKALRQKQPPPPQPSPTLSGPAQAPVAPRVHLPERAQTKAAPSGFWQLVLIVNLILLTLILAGGCFALVLWTQPAWVAALLGTPPATATPVAATAPINTPPAMANVLPQPTTPVPATLPPPATVPPLPTPTITPTEMSLPPTATFTPTATLSPTFAPTPIPTSTSSPTPIPSPTTVNVESSVDNLNATNILAEQIGVFRGSSYGLDIDAFWYCSQYSDPTGGQTNQPRLYGHNDGRVSLINFQPYEGVRLFVYPTINSANSVGWQNYQVDEQGRLDIRLTGLNSDQNYVFIIFGDSSGEIINASGYAPCKSIQLADYVVASGNTQLFDDNFNLLGRYPIPPGTLMRVVTSQRTDLDTLWWKVQLDDESIGWVLDRQVSRRQGTIAPPPTPVDSAGVTTRPSPEAAAQEYFDLINQGQYQITWNRLSSSYRSTVNKNDFDEYRLFWESVANVQLYNTQVSFQDESFATVEGTLSIVYKDEPPFSNSNYQIELIWDSNT